MAKIEVLNGVRYKPEMFIKRMNRSRKLEGIECRHINTLYSLCWVFQLRIMLQATKKTSRYAGYYAGFDESVLSSGKLAFLPSATEQTVDDICVMADKLTEEEALEKTWEYNKMGVLRKFKNLYAPPVLEDYVVERFYKPLYVFEFYNPQVNETKYKILDSLTGDLDDINITD